MPTGSQPAYRAPSTAGTKSDIYATLTSSEEEDEYDESLGLQPGDLLGGNFELTEVVGRGAMGEVWLARELVKGEYSRDVVVKIVPKNIQNAEVEIERVRATFLTIQELQHAHICPVYYLGSDDRFGYFLVMKYIVGQNLSDYVKDYRKQNKKQPTLDDLLPMLAQFSSALDYAHSKGVIHRDVKPQNLFHSPKDGAQLIDFGLAESVKTDDDDGTSSAVSGTIVYMSPEQLQGEHQDKHSDQYSFAATVYELLTGQPPFVASTYDHLLDRILYDPVMPVGNVADSVNDALARALSKSREDRFETCTEFVEALKEGAGVVPEKKKAVPKTSGLVDPEIISLTKRAHLFLEESEWQRAEEYFERVLDKDAEYAPAYVGLLCAELKTRSEGLLGDHEKPISGHKHFQKAVRFADDGYKTQIEGYDEKIRERLRQEQYDGLVQRKHKATEQQCLPLAKEFRAMNGYKDTTALADECEKQYHVLKEEREERERQSQYDRLVAEKNQATSESQYKDLVHRFRAMTGYKDTASLADECEKQYQVLREQREEQERQSQYNRLVVEKNRASHPLEYQGLVKRFQEMDGYKDTIELANECESQYCILKEKQERWKAGERERLQREKEEQERREAEERERELQEQYDRLVREKDVASTEDEYEYLVKAFRGMNGYEDTVELAEKCDERYRQLKVQREAQERQERERREKQERIEQKYRDKKKSREKTLERIEETLTKMGEKLGPVGCCIGISVVLIFVYIAISIGRAALVGCLIGVGIGILILLTAFRDSKANLPILFPVVIGPVVGLLAGAVIDVLYKIFGG